MVGYFILLDDHIFRQSRKEYIQILNLFVRKKISLDVFFNQFYSLRDFNRKASKLWKDNLKSEVCEILTKSNETELQLNPEACGFT